MAEEKPIIVIKKKGGHGGHHGGAWKVAYADFVTAMMCFFMVMWLINSADAPTRKSIAQYFLARPGFFDSGSGSPISAGQTGIFKEGYPPDMKHTEKYATGGERSQMRKKSGAEDVELEGRGAQGMAIEATPPASTPPPGTPTLSPEELAAIRGPAGSLPGLIGGKDLTEQLAERVAQQIRYQIASSPELREFLGVVDVKVDADGLNIEILDTEKTSMFNSGSPVIRQEAEAAFLKIAGILAKLPNEITIVGHTDAKPFARSARGYTNWELSADRANAARRVLERAGMQPNQITSVLGRADRELKNPNDPFAASNRRITLKMRFPIDQTIDLSKDPNALDTLSTTSGQATDSPTQAEEPVHSFSPKDILEKREERDKTPIKLPEHEPPVENPPPPPERKQNLIFSDNPVLGPPSPFSNF